MASEQELGIFSTRDIYLASALITLGFSVESIDYQVEGDRSQPVGYFKFEESEELNNAQKDFWASRLLVEPRQFIASMRGLKAQLNNVYKSPTANFGSFKGQ